MILHTTSRPSRCIAPSPRSGRVAKQQELAKREVAKQQVCEADKVRTAQLVPHSLCKQWTVWRGTSPGACAMLVNLRSSVSPPMRAVFSRSVFLQVSAAEVGSHFNRNFPGNFGAVPAFPMCTGAVISFLQRLIFVPYSPFALHTQSEKPLLLGRRSSLHPSHEAGLPRPSRSFQDRRLPPTPGRFDYPLGTLHSITCPFGRCPLANRCPPHAAA